MTTGLAIYEKNVTRKPSLSLVSKMPRDFWYNPTSAKCFYDDFLVKNAAAQASSTFSNWAYLAADSGASVSQLATETGGVLRLTTGGTDNNEAYITAAGGQGAMFKFGAGAKRFIWEFGIRLGAVADQGVLVGLTEEALAAANTLADNTGAPADKDYIGYRILALDSDGIDAVYNTASGGGETVHKEEAKVATANEWINLGGFFDGVKHYWYVNGVVVDRDGVRYDAANMPDGEELVPFVGLKTGEGVSKTIDIDFALFAQAA